MNRPETRQPAAQRRALRAILAALPLLLALAAPAAPARAGRAAAPASLRSSPPRILQPPRGHAIVTGRSFRVVAALPRDAGKIGARIDEQGVAGRFHRRRDGRYAARIPTRLTGGPGFHFLLITYADASGRHSLGCGLIVARKRQRARKPRHGPPLLRARLASRRVVGVARLRLSAPRADQWSVRVNGRDVSDRFAGQTGFLRDGSLSASTGLHRGRNQVAVVVARDDGTHAVRRFTVRVNRPIPDAGRPRRVAAGRRVRLGSPGGAAEPSRRGTVLEHTWTIASAPKRSKARLRHPRAERPTFRPDVKGTYWIADRVTERTRAGKLVGRSGRDLVEVAATPSYVPPIGEPIETLALGSEGKLGVKLGSSFFALEGGQGAVQVLMIDPTTLATWTKTFEAPAEALGAIESGDTESGTIVVVQGRELPRECWETSEGARECWTEAIGSQIGVSSQWESVVAGVNPSFSAIGVKGIPAGQAWANAVASAPGSGATGALRGYIAPNYESAESSEGATYTFTPSTYLSYDTNTTGAGAGATSVTAQVGTTQVSGSVPSGQVGFLVAEFDAGDLVLRSSQSFAIAAAGGEEATNRSEVEALAAWLEKRESDPGALVLVQSIGALPTEPPRPPVSQYSGEEERYKLVEAWARAAEAIGELGGHQGPFLSGGGGGYSFLGGSALAAAGVPPAENATTMLQYDQPEVVRLAGMLQLGHLGTLVPAASTSIATKEATVESNPEEVGNFELPLIAYQHSTPWPYEPGSLNEDAAVVAAGHYISNRICNPGCENEVRHEYVSSNFDLEQLVEEAEERGFGCPAEEEWEGTAFTKEDCKAALEEFEKEDKKVTHINEYFSTSNGFRYPFSSVASEQQSGLQKIGNDIEAGLHPPPEQETHIEWELFAQTFAIALSAVDVPETAAFGTMMDVGLNMATAFAVTPAGESVFEAEAEVQGTVAKIEEMASAQQEAFGNIKALIVSDYGKLGKLTALTSGRYPQWNLPSDWSDVKDQLRYGLRGAFYRSFLPAVSEGDEHIEGEPTGYHDVVLTQNVCITHSEGEGEEGAPEAPRCAEAGSPEWTTVPPRELTEGLVCWDFYYDPFPDWHTEKMGKHWAEAEYVAPEANAIWEWHANPYYPLEPTGTYMLAYSPRWQVAIDPEKPFSSSEAPFPLSVAREISGKPEAGNLDGGLPRWALFEALNEERVVRCPEEWAAVN